VLIGSTHKDSLINTNSYLRDSKRREALLVKTVVSSAAVEGVHLDWDDLKELRSLSIELRKSNETSFWGGPLG
jgi:hypothetical protein